MLSLSSLESILTMVRQWHFLEVEDGMGMSVVGDGEGGWEDLPPITPSYGRRWKVQIAGGRLWEMDSGWRKADAGRSYQWQCHGQWCGYDDLSSLVHCCSGLGMGECWQNLTANEYKLSDNIWRSGVVLTNPTTEEIMFFFLCSPTISIPKPPKLAFTTAQDWSFVISPWTTSHSKWMQLSTCNVVVGGEAKTLEELLGVHVPNDTSNCLQDIHWSCLAIGYLSHLSYWCNDGCATITLLSSGYSK